MSAPEKPATILVVDDEAQIRRALNSILSTRGYRVLSAADAEEGLDLAIEHTPDLIVMDMALPGMSGLEACRELRNWYVAPILVLSVRGADADKIAALDAGADDYVTKPFSAGELLARIKAILRRLERVAPLEEIITIGEARVDLKKHIVTRHRLTEPISFYEVELLKLLYEHKDEPVSRDEILDRIWGLDASPTNRTVDNFVVKLRRKVEEDHKQPRHILTVYGLGYKLVP